MSGERYRLTWASSCLLVFSVHVRSWHILRMSFVVFVYWYALFVHDIFSECLLLFLFIGMLCSFMTYFQNVFCCFCLFECFCFCLLVCSVCSFIYHPVRIIEQVIGKLRSTFVFLSMGELNHQVCCFL